VKTSQTNLTKQQNQKATKLSKKGHSMVVPADGHFPEGNGADHSVNDVP